MHISDNPLGNFSLNTCTFEIYLHSQQCQNGKNEEERGSPRQESGENGASLSNSGLGGAISSPTASFSARETLKRFPFSRIVREIAQDFMEAPRFKTEAISALQYAAESYLVRIFEDTHLIARYARRVTVYSTDISLVGRIRGEIEYSSRLLLRETCPYFLYLLQLLVYR